MAQPGTKKNRGVLGTEAKHVDASSQSILDRIDLTSTDRTIEEQYLSEVATSHRKKYAQFFTPDPVAELMVRWIAGCQPRRILDPSVGTGIFPRQILEQISGSEVTGLDIDGCIIEVARASLGPSRRVHLLQQDFLTWDSRETFDACISNPPYLRHHDVSYDFDIFTYIGKQSGLKLSKLSNLYVLFILEGIRRLSVGGRGAFIVPSEWMNANFGVTLKHFLIHNGFLRKLIYFSHAELIFDNALTTACVLLLERPRAPSGDHGIAIINVTGNAALPALDLFVQDGDVQGARIVKGAELLEIPKWDDFLARGQKPEATLGFVPLATLAATKRGLATGANHYFHLTPERASEAGISEEHLKFCVGKAQDIPGAIFSSADKANLHRSLGRCLLVDLKGPMSLREERYVDEGVRQGLDTRFLLSTRKPWYSMESREPAPIWAAVFGRKGLRFVYNEARVWNLTTFHCIYPRFSDEMRIKALVACLNSPIVQESSRSHQRVYGGGLYKFEPKDLLDIQVPDVRKATDATIRGLVRSLDELDSAWRVKSDTAELEMQLDRFVELAASETAAS